MMYCIILAEYDESTDSTDYIDSGEAMCKEDAVEAFRIGLAYLNSLECNHDQLDRGE
jgi:hypothetical protein